MLVNQRKKAVSLEAQFWIAILIGMLAFVGAGAWLSYPHHTNEAAKPPAHEQQNPSNPNTVPPNVIGTVVIAAPNQSSHASAKGGDAAGYNKPPLGFWDAKITDLALVLFTYCLVVVGWATMRSGERSVRMLERGFLFLEVVTDGAGGSPKGGIKDIKFMPDDAEVDSAVKDSDTRGAIIGVRFRNHGRTPAVITSLRSNVRYFPGTPRLTAKELKLPEGPFVVRSGELSHEFYDGFSITYGEWKSRYDDGGIYLIGEIFYLDIFQRPHTTGFCWKWNPFGKEFFAAENHILNFFT
jgi:hypothetical protein